MNKVANTVLGELPAEELGVVAPLDALLSIVPGAQYAYDIEIDRAQIFDILKARLEEFVSAGGGTVVDASGMFHGRDIKLYRTLAHETGVNIIASTGMGPESNLGGYFLTPQTNPPTPWPADRFADLFAAEIGEGMVIPRVERLGHAGLIVTATSPEGRTPTDESLVRGAARAARMTGAPVSIRFGADPISDLELALEEGVAPARIVISGLDRRDAVGAASQIAERGAVVGIDHIGSDDSRYLSDDERIALITGLIADDHAGRILLSAGAVGVGKGEPSTETTFATVLTDFVPRLRAAGIAASDIHTMLVANPADLLTVKED